MPENYRRMVVVRVLIITASVIVAAGGLFWFAGDIAAQAKKVSGARFDSALQAKLVERLASLKTIATEAGGYERRLNALLPTRDELLDFPRWLEGVARVEQVAINFGFQGAAVAAQANEPGFINFSLDASAASFGALEKFFISIERAPRFFVNFTSFDVSWNQERGRAVAQGQVFFR